MIWISFGALYAAWPAADIPRFRSDGHGALLAEYRCRTASISPSGQGRSR